MAYSDPTQLWTVEIQQLWRLHCPRSCLSYQPRVCIPQHQFWRNPFGCQGPATASPVWLQLQQSGPLIFWCSHAERGPGAMTSMLTSLDWRKKEYSSAASPHQSERRRERARERETERRPDRWRSVFFIPALSIQVWITGAPPEDHIPFRSDPLRGFCVSLCLGRA